MDIYVHPGDTFPPLTVSNENGQLNLHEAESVWQSVDGGDLEPAELNPDGTVKVPPFDEGEHSIRYEIRWPGGIVQLAPSLGPARVIAQDVRPLDDQVGEKVRQSKMKTARAELRTTPQRLAAIDEARGLVSRNAWIEDAIDRALREDVDQ